MSVTREDILKALSRVSDPATGKDLVAADMVRAPAFDENTGLARFILEVDPARGKALEPLLKAAEAALEIGEAAGEGAAISHQAFGAIGFTKEHILHRFVQRLWSWRDDFDNETVWAVDLGRRVAAGGGEGLWHSLTAA